MQTSPDPSDRVFSRAVAFVIDVLEGGERPVIDSGWLTRFGISQRSHPTVDVARITRADAEAIYHRDYWSALRAELLPPAIALLLFAAAVNLGNTPAARILQHCVGVKQDGIVGQVTQLEVYRHDQRGLGVTFSTYWLRSYYELVTERPEFLKYLDGWNRRVLLTLDEAARWDS